MIFHPVLGYEDLYEISKCGVIKSLDRLRKCSKNGKLCIIKGRILKQRINKHGYMEVGLSKDGNKKTILIHRLIAENFIERNVNHECVNHINGIKHDNRIENLEWCTYSENNKHAYEYGLKKPYIRIGSKNPKNKINEDMAIQVKRLILQGVPNVRICEMFGLNKCTVSNIKTGATWAWLVV